MSVEVQFSMYYEFTHEQWIEAEQIMDSEMEKYLYMLHHDRNELSKILAQFGFVYKDTFTIYLTSSFGSENKGIKNRGMESKWKA